MIDFQPDSLPPNRNFIDKLGRLALLKTRNTGRAVLVFMEALLFMPTAFKRKREIIRQMMICGVRSLPIVSLIAIFTGMILSLQAGLILMEYNQEASVGSLVSETMVREMGPFMTALILAASVGSAYAAEIGTMRVSEEISALEVMSINPVSYLVMPRLLAMTFMIPALTIFANLLGVLGGMVVATNQLNVNATAYKQMALQFLTADELWNGLIKSIVFGAIVVTVSCYQGFATTNGAIGVGRATRSSVVVSFVLILISGYFITWLIY